MTIPLRDHSPPHQSHTLVMLIRNSSTILHRIVSIIRRHRLVLQSLTMSPTEQTGHSRLVCVVAADDVTRVLRQLAKLVDVLQVHEVPPVAPDPSLASRATTHALPQADGTA